eukprot:TRINITY_DN3058_c1_g6_i1.p1 TRINITY_DN3058_c1_g6~~TRINITY_DN3058_c1_g6_i1.p1  ORF type:complete len:128 (-),score=24.36 TRINITY_DN3058_c1_g6_i1:569-952(-)
MFTDKHIIICSLIDFSIICGLINDTYVNGICFSHCSNHMYFGDESGDKDVVFETKIHNEQICKLKLSLDGKYLLTWSSDKTAKLINPKNFSVFCSIRQDAVIFSIDLNSTGSFIAIDDKGKKLSFGI